MPKICYKKTKFNAQVLEIINKANVVIDEYMAQGYSITVRQLYYQFVARDLFPDAWKMSFTGRKWIKDPNGTNNNGPAYTKLQGIISAARTAGYVDWLAIIDSTRGVVKNQHWTKPSEALKSISETYKIEKWFNQPNYVEVWVEKDALATVLTQSCMSLDVPFFACRGYTSSSEIWVGAQRLLEQIGAGKNVTIIHLGDHDPSGVDMSRDIKERLQLYTGHEIPVLRVALNMSQIRRYNPPPQPAKKTDVRFEKYRAKFGDESWELDALAPTVLIDIVTRAVTHFRDEELWKESIKLEGKGKQTLDLFVSEYPHVVNFLSEKIKSVNEKDVRVD